MSAQQAERSRITLVEVLVIVLILVVLVLLLMPPLHLVNDRHVAITQCLNNLKQMSLAVHAFQTTRKGKLPTGTIVGSAKEPEERLSLLVWLLPYMEHERLYKQLDREQGWQAEANKPLVAQVVPTYQCYAAPHGDPERRHLTDYVGIAGVGEDAASLPAKHPRAGIFGYDRQLSITDLSDGASQTLLFVETRKDPGSWAAGGPATLRAINPDEARPFRDDGAFGSAHRREPSFWPRRQRLSNVALADGSVRAVSASISPEVLAALATVAGGEELPADW